jgi:hypothetical protein
MGTTELSPLRACEPRLMLPAVQDAILGHPDADVKEAAER